MLNAFRIIGDGSHVFGICLLFCKFFSSSSVSGISAKTQFLFTLTYALRYLDLFTNWISYYNTTLKIFFIAASALSFFIVGVLFRKDYEKNYDTFWVELLVVPILILALFVTHDPSIMEICWTWSIYLEALAIIPQFYMSWRGAKVDAYVVLYVLTLLVYRGSYIGNWAYRYYFEDYYDIIAVSGGIAEVFLALVGLIVTLIRFNDKGGYALGLAKENPSIYTLPFVANMQGRTFTRKGALEGKGLVGDLGPYHPDLSVPILDYEETEHPNA